ncbi:AfsR/SARP family transcriptional regulator [Flexivirga meconopsidis]|uniref:AfsR/SARP family transcriptional regulator n=1 Tax=Flexivirga meconopsidis TaxID=2977121 RepID=UPI0022408233|nr:BTAD domain-containing putative transcriptional regulator [Flexivirga meconopsidis]
MRGEGMQLRVLSAVELRCGADTLPLSQLERALLARVAVGTNAAASVDALVAWIWGGEAPTSARNRVQALVSGLRRKCDRPLLETTKSGYRLADEVESDLATWRDLVAADPELAPDERWRSLDTALALFDEAPLQNIPGTEDVRLAQETLQSDRLAVLEESGDLALGLGELRGLASTLTQLVQEHPFHEAFVAQLMRALAATGRQEEALRVYRDTYRRLSDELGVGPSDVLRAAHHDVLHGTAAPDLAASSGDQDGTETVAAQALPIPRMLPRDPANFVGRDADVETIRRAASDALRAPVTVSITGTTGVGKSALAVHGGRLIQATFPDGTLYADLGNGDQALAVGEVLGSFLRLLGLRGDAIPEELADRVGLFRSILEHRRVLIVLDNVAEMTHEATAALELLVPVAAGSMAIVTSRTAHHDLPDALAIRLRSLQIDEATALLAAMLGDDRVAADRDGASALLDATGRLPLAIRLVAGRLVNRPDRQFGDMAHRLVSQPMQDRDPLEGLRESVRMVWERRSPAQQSAIGLLARLPVAGFSAWLPGALLGDEDAGDELIEALLATNLIEPVTTDDGMTLYRLHDLVTQFVTSTHRVDDADVTAATVSIGRALLRRAAAGHNVFHRRLVPSPPPLTDDDNAPLTSNAVAVREFFRSDGAAMLTIADALVPTTPDLAWRLVLASANAQHTFSGHRSWLRVATSVRARLTGPSADQQLGRALLQLAESWHRQDLRSQSQDALSLAEAARKALTLLGETDGAAAADIVVAHAAVSLGRRAAAERALDRAESLLRHHPDATYPGWACAIRGLLHNDYDELDAAEHELVRARDILAGDGDRIAYATATIELARVEWRQHKLGTVNVLVTEAISLLQKYNEQHLLSYALDARAEMSYQLGRDEQALQEADVVWRRAVDSADDFLAARVRRTRARALAALDRLDEAESELRASIEECTTLDRPLSVAAAMHDLSAVLSAQGRHAAAAELRRLERAARASADLACREEFDEAYGREVGQDAGPAGR